MSDRAGVRYQLIDGRRYYSPTGLGLHGVRFLDSYVRTGNPAYLRRAVAHADRLLRMRHRAGRALFLPHQRDWRPERLEAPWYSAHSQGQVLSFFVRLYRVTGEVTYLRAARAVLMSFRQLGPRDAPWVAYTSGGFLWFEEYPTRPPTHVLNGHIHALLGIWEFERLTRDPVARQMLEAGLTTVRHNARRHRVPGGLSYYDQVHFTRWRHYHRLHVRQLGILHRVSGDGFFRRLADAFAEDASPAGPGR
jgi:hypothetical protein